MTDEPRDREDSEQQDEGAPAADPVAGEGPSSSQAPEEDPTPTPPAEEESVGEQAQDDASEGEPAASPPAEDGKDAREVIPGADLEPIAVEPEERPLSAEEQARREAEEEERRQREEAALAGEAEERERPKAASPARMESGARYAAVGKRKRSVARVTLLPGSGEIEVNKRPLEEFFPRPLHQTMARQPLAATGYEKSVDVRVRVDGGGIGGQAGAVRHGVARALTEVDPELRGELKRRGYLTRDARAKERRKAGLKKARKKPQFSKR